MNRLAVQAIRSSLLLRRAGNVHKFSAPFTAQPVLHSNNWPTSTRFYSSHAPHQSPKQKLTAITYMIMNILAKHAKLKDAPEKVTPTSHFIQDLGLDSLDHAEICYIIEETYMIEIPDEAAFKLLTVPALAEHIFRDPLARTPLYLVDQEESEHSKHQDGH